MPTDRALRPSCSRYIRARGAGPPEAIGEAGGRPRNRSSHPAAQCALPPPWPSVCVSRALMAISRLVLALAMHCECIRWLYLLFHPFAPEEVWFMGPGNLKQLIIEWYKAHPAFAGSDAWCKGQEARPARRLRRAARLQVLLRVHTKRSSGSRCGRTCPAPLVPVLRASGTYLRFHAARP